MCIAKLWLEQNLVEEAKAVGSPDQHTGHLAL